MIKAMPGLDGAPVWRVKQARSKRGLTTKRPRGCCNRRREELRDQTQAPPVSASMLQGSRALCWAWCHQPPPGLWPCFGTCLSSPPEQRSSTRVPASFTSPTGGADVLYVLPSGFSKGDLRSQELVWSVHRSGRTRVLHQICCPFAFLVPW